MHAWVTNILKKKQQTKKTTNKTPKTKLKIPSFIFVLHLISSPTLVQTSNTDCFPLGFGEKIQSQAIVILHTEHNGGFH